VQRVDDSPLFPSRPESGTGGAGRGAGDDLGVAANNAPAILFLSDPRGAITYVTRRWHAASGQPVGEALGAGWLEAVHPEDRALVADSFRAAHEKREPFTADFRLRDEGAGHRWVTAAGRPLFDAAGDLAGFAGSVLDVDDRKRAELALRRAQQVARFLANASVALTDLSDPRAILKKVAGLCVPFLADWCVVDVARDDSSLERLVVVHGEPVAAPARRPGRPRQGDPVRRAGAGR
jgi:PAS domain S-box-containing protein